MESSIGETLKKCRIEAGKSVVELSGVLMSEVFYDS